MNSLIIARGEVVFRETPGTSFVGNHIIAGKSVKLSSKEPNIIREDDLNPLGFIRWSDAPKEKAAPK